MSALIRPTEISGLLVAGLILVLSSVSFSQPIYTKDMVFLGYREDYMSSCMGETKGKYFNINNKIIDKYYYCVCVCDELLPRLKSKDIRQAINNNDFAGLLLQKKYYKILHPCVEHYAVIEDAYAMGSGEQDSSAHGVYTRMCIDNFYEGNLLNQMYAEEMVLEYCDCLITAIMEKGFTYEQVIAMENENSEAFNEVALPCYDNLLSPLDDYAMGSGYVREDITGDDSVSIVPLIDYMNRSYKVKVVIDGVSRYYLFDTGASMFIIDSDVERELRLNGSINESSYIGKETFSLADNKQVVASVVELNNVQIGDYTVDHVVAAIIDQGALLCGISLLNKFRNWELNMEKQQLILYK
jgi:hypothetical protein